jgi:hypothetical protein
MRKYNVHIYREMRLVYQGIEADSPQAAAAIAREKPTGDADEIDDCEGETLSALVDVAGDTEYEQSEMIDFEGERVRKAAPALMTALESIVDYAENEASSLESLKDSPEAEAEAERAWRTVEAARATIAQAKASGIAATPGSIDIHALLAGRRQIASIWSVEDVQSIRPDLTDEQALAVLKAAEDGHDATIGINWDVLECHAQMLYGDAPDTHAAEEE